MPLPVEEWNKIEFNLIELNSNLALDYVLKIIKSRTVFWKTVFQFHMSYCPTIINYTKSSLQTSQLPLQLIIYCLEIQEILCYKPFIMHQNDFSFLHLGY